MKMRKKNQIFEYYTLSFEISMKIIQKQLNDKKLFNFVDNKKKTERFMIVSSEKHFNLIG